MQHLTLTLTLTPTLTPSPTPTPTQVIDGMLTVRKIENVPVGGGSKPLRTISISECGEM